MAGKAAVASAAVVKGKGGGGGGGSNNNHGNVDNNNSNAEHPVATAEATPEPVVATPAIPEPKSNKKTQEQQEETDNSTASKKKTSTGGTILWKTFITIYTTCYLFFLIQCLIRIALEAYNIRLHAINEFGPIIHEFDPYFNFRATEYLYEHGWHKFATWFDYLVWYPLGRPVGTTIYPGMQVSAVFIKNWIMKDWSLNDVCCYMPAWYGAIASLMTGLMTYECSVGTVTPNIDLADKVAPIAGQEGEVFTSFLKHVPIINLLYRHVLVPITTFLLNVIHKIFHSTFGLRASKIHSTVLASPALETSIFASALMSIVPAHIMRSVGGGYDNESVAITAMTTTFYLWVRSLRGGPDAKSYWFGILTGVAYFYMVACWGGYIFVINLIGVHASLLVLCGKYSTKLYRAYTLFYIVGTGLAIQVPVVGWTPLRSLEQLGPCVAFLGFQLIELAEILRKRWKLHRMQAWKLRVQVFLIGAAIGGIIVYLIWPTGYFGPISSRVRGLFVKHTKTGNPLVDSVAEHQPASAQAYFQYLHDVCYIAPVGFALIALFYFHDSSSFLLVYGTAAYFFSHKMVRLVLLTAPIACALGGLALGRVWGWCLRSVVDYTPSVLSVWDAFEDDDNEEKQEDEEKKEEEEKKKKKELTKKAGSSKKERKKLVKKDAAAAAGEEPEKSDGDDSSKKKGSTTLNIIRFLFVKAIRIAISALAIYKSIPYFQDFYDTSHQMAKQMSHPTILFKGENRQTGQSVLVDDYREAYWWLRDNTPADARIMAWWDYGYQITAIANRTTIADGNTWNHEHIALLGRTLTSPEKEAHRIARHLADYVLVWAGGGGDDLAKSPHLRRIANSVYRGMCPGDPTCRSFGFTQTGPSPSMEASLLYKLHSHRLKPGVEVDKNRFKEVFGSKHGKVRIFKILSVSKESKAWVANPANRLCDVEGGWFCRGQYPPALEKVLKQKQDFAQLEDFNVDKEDSEYQKQYFENLNNPDKARAAVAEEMRKTNKGKAKKLRPEEISQLNKKWENTEATTTMWQLISRNDVKQLKEWIMAEPAVVHMRSADGRGPMWWAMEYKRDNIVKMLKKLGVRDTYADADGLTPLDVAEG